MLLRVLEYYEGILILSKSPPLAGCIHEIKGRLATNRIRDMDVAVQSRIHLAIKYDDLTRDQQIRIFETFLSQVHEKGHVENWDRVRKWVEKDATSTASKFNGRQIRNIVSSAMGLARAGDRRLRYDDLRMRSTVRPGTGIDVTAEQIANMTKDFKQDTQVQEALYRQSQIEFR